MIGSANRVEVLGRDVAREAYRIRARIDGRRVVAYVPECLMDSLRPGDRPSHQEAYEWIALHGPRLHAAAAALIIGQMPRKPFDLMELEVEGHDAH